MHIYMVRYLRSRVVENFNPVELTDIKDIKRFRGPGVDQMVRFKLRHVGEAEVELSDGTTIKYRLDDETRNKIQEQNHAPIKSPSKQLVGKGPTSSDKRNARRAGLRERENGGAGTKEPSHDANINTPEKGT